MRSAFVILLISVSLHIFYVIKYQALVDIFIFHSIRLSKRKKTTNASITTVLLCKSTFGITSVGRPLEKVIKDERLECNVSWFF